jgi:hypothetical protein
LGIHFCLFHMKSTPSFFLSAIQFMIDGTNYLF